MPQPKVKSKKLSALWAILRKGDQAEIRYLFAFNKDTSEADVLKKFNIWARYFFPDFFKFKDAPFHRDIDRNNLRIYRGEKKYFVNIVFRGGSKTTRTKLFAAFVLANDKDHFRRYLKVLCKDASNAQQFVTDIYNLLINKRVCYFYPEIFRETNEKREERMSSFTTATGIKVKAGTVGTEQRGDIQDDARPDWVIFDDFETRKTLRSAVETNSIWENMEEARTGLSKNGGASYLCNYLSERGNVHKLIKDSDNRVVLIVPIIKDGIPAWSSYTVEEIENIKKDAEDFEGEYLCEPSAGLDIFFDRESLDRQKIKEPVKEVAGFKMFYEFDPSHRYGSGHDVAGGVGLDSSTSVFIDFTPLPARVVGTFKSNTIKPDTFGDEIEREACLFGKPVVAPESNNHGHATIARLKQIYDNIFFKEEKETKVGIASRARELGWHTNNATKPKMMFELKKAVEDGHLELNDKDLIAELRSYTRDDLMDKEVDPRLSTRHFDLLIACAIAWQMRNYAEAKVEPVYKQRPYEPQSEYEGVSHSEKSFFDM